MIRPRPRMGWPLTLVAITLYAGLAFWLLNKAEEKINPLQLSLETWQALNLDDAK